MLHFPSRYFIRGSFILFLGSPKTVFRYFWIYWNVKYILTIQFKVFIIFSRAFSLRFVCYITPRGDKTNCEFCGKGVETHGWTWHLAGGIFSFINASSLLLPAAPPTAPRNPAVEWAAWVDGFLPNGGGRCLSHT